MPLDDYVQDIDTGLTELVETKVQKSKPVSEYRDIVTSPKQEEVSLEETIVSEGTQLSLQEGADIEEVAKQTDAAVKASKNIPTEVQEVDKFIKDNASEEALSSIVKAIRDQKHTQDLVKKSVDLEISNLLADYDTSEKVADFLTSMVPFEGVEDNLDMFDNVFKGGSMRKMHDMFWSTDDPQVREGILQYARDMSKDMEKIKVQEFLTLLSDPNGADELDSFFGLNGGFWTGLDLVGLGASKVVVNSLNNLIKRAAVVSRPVDALSEVNPKKSRELLTATAKGDVVDPLMSKREAVLKADTTAPEGMYKAGDTIGIYDETLTPGERARYLADAVEGNDFLLRESMLSDEFLSKIRTAPEKEVRAARIKAMSFIKTAKEKAIPFSKLDEVLGDRLRIVLGDEDYDQLRNIEASGIDPDVKLDYVSRSAQGLEVKILDQDNSSPTSVRLKYAVSYPNWTKIVEKEEVMSVDEITEGLGDVDVGAMRDILASNTAKYSGSAREVAKKFLGVERLDSRMSESLRQILNAARKPIGKTFIPGTKSKHSLDRVGLTLETLDDVGEGMLARVPEPNELRAGMIELADGSLKKLPSKLNDAEVEVFYNMREVLDQLQRIGNSEERRSKAAKGFVGIRSDAQLGAEGVIAKPISNTATIKEIALGNEVYIPSRDPSKLSRITAEEVDDLVNRGYVLVRTEGPEILPVVGKDEYYDLAMVHKSNIGELPLEMRGYKTNYLPRIYESEYWVRSKYKRKVNGKDVEYTKAVLQTDLLDEAWEFMTANKDKYDFPKGKNGELLPPLRNREAQNEGLTGAGSNNTAGTMIYSKSRAKEEVRYGRDMVKAPRVSAFDAVSRYVNNLSGFVSRNEMRLGVERQWLNDAININPKNLDENFHTAKLPDTEQGRALEKFRQQIKEWSRVPTTEEMWWQRKMQTVYEWAMKGVDGPNADLLKKSFYANKIAKYAKWAKAGDPIGFFRNVSFNMYLGMFNPVQLLVQAQQSAIGFTLHPRNYGKALKLQMALSMMDAAHRGGGMSKKMFPHLKKVFGHNLTDSQLEDLFRAWNKSGMFESVVNTADYAAVASGQALTGAGMSRLLEKGQIFYRMGVLSEKRVNFVLSYLDKMKEFKHGKIGEKQLIEVTRRADELSFEMGKMNRARWQKGVLSLPTQFLQIFGKTIENMLPAVGLKGSGNFSQKQALFMFAGIAALYGAAGNPITAAVQRTYAMAFEEDELEVESDGTSAGEVAVRNGVLGLLPYYLSMMTGKAEGFEIGARFSPISGVDQLLDEALFEKSGAEVMFGAFGGLSSRFGEVWQTFSEVSLNAIMNQEVPSGVDFLRIGESIISTTSTFRNLSQGAKALFLDEIRSTSGVLLKQDLGTFEGVMKGLGIISTDLARVYSIEDLERHKQELFTAKTSRVRGLVVDYFRYHDKMGAAEMRDLRQRMGFILRSVKNPVKRSDMFRQAFDTAHPALSKEDKQLMNQFRRDFINEFNITVFDAATSFQQGVGE